MKSTYRQEPANAHGAPSRTGVLLVNLGSPETPGRGAVRAYLREFLSDPRVVEIPRALWWPILYGAILPSRPAASARKYQAVWTPEGAPLRVHTQRQAKLLHGYLGQAGHEKLLVDYAMRYGEPSVGAVLDGLKRAGCSRILIVPLYPQYASSTTGSVYDAVTDWSKAIRNVPELRLIRDFHDFPGYIAALAAAVNEHSAKNGRPEKLVMSFHGLPRRTLELGDPYHDECQSSARRLASALGLQDREWLLTFQSRFGRAEWLQPYTQPSLEELARRGVKRVDVICPGFVSDCLETLEEIGMECKSAFLAAGGTEFHLIPCLNERHEWIAALAALVGDHLGGWPTRARSPAASVSTDSR